MEAFFPPLPCALAALFSGTHLIHLNRSPILYQIFPLDGAGEFFPCFSFLFFKNICGARQKVASFLGTSEKMGGEEEDMGAVYMSFLTIYVQSTIICMYKGTF